MLLVIDNYDSFTYNLVHYAQEMGAQTHVIRNDDMSANEALNQQSIGQAFGGKVIHAKQIMHGKVSDIHHDNTGLFESLDNPFKATRYHSLSVERHSLPDCLAVNAWTDDQEIMSLRHKTRPIHGLQFHPESIASENGHALIAKFLQIAGLK